MPVATSPVKLNNKQAADYIGVSPSTLNSWRVRNPDGPRFIKVGRSVRYLKNDLDQWLEDHAGTCTADFS